MSHSSPGSKNGRRVTAGGLAFLLLLLVALGAGVAALAKYVLSSQHSTLAEATEFRFAGDYLAAGAPVPEYDIYTGSANLTVTNSDGLTPTPVDTIYTIEVMRGAADVTESVLKLGRDAVRSGAAQTLAGGAHTDHTYTLTGAAGQSYTVTAVSTAPYAQTLAGVFTFGDAAGATVYEIKNAASHCELILYTGNTAPAPIIAWNAADFAPDNTSGWMETWTDGAPPGALAHTLSGLTANSTYTLVFFKQNDRIYPPSGQITLEGGAMIALPASSSEL